MSKAVYTRTNSEPFSQCIENKRLGLEHVLRMKH